MEKAFNKAFSEQQYTDRDTSSAQPRVKTQSDEDAELRDLRTKMDASDAVSRMLLAQRDGDYFRQGSCNSPLLHCTVTKYVGYCSCPSLLTSELRETAAYRILACAFKLVALCSGKYGVLSGNSAAYLSCRLLELPAPEADALGRPAWPCTSSDISKAYRRLSALVHPDKNPAKDARQAFEALNQAHKALRDAGQLVRRVFRYLGA